MPDADERRQIQADLEEMFHHLARLQEGESIEELKARWRAAHRSALEAIAKGNGA
jgi:hypothetical protein